MGGLLRYPGGLWRQPCGWWCRTRLPHRAPDVLSHRHLPPIHRTVTRARVVAGRADPGRSRSAGKGDRVSTKAVLIVHEDADLVASLKSALHTIDPVLEVRSALSGPRAMGMMTADKPSVLVVDAQLTGLNGYDFARQVKTSKQLSDVPVLLVSLEASEILMATAREAGADDLMSVSLPIHVIARRALELADAVPVAVGAPGDASRSPGQDAQSSGVPSVTGATGAPIPTTSVIQSGIPSGPKSDLPHVDDLLRLMLGRGGSDLHITVGSPPGIRQRGHIVPVENTKTLTPRDTAEMILGLLSEEQRRRYETELELDFAYNIPGVSRFRANVFQQRGSMGAVFRVIPIRVPTIEELGLPKVCTFLADRPRGLVLVTGPTGSGKSTTLASMIDHINQNRALHIITLEDPIEFLHSNKKCYVNQREVGEDTHSFGSALKRVLRQDPDVILVGEMRDLEAIGAAITAAETGHLVLATLHTTGGPETIDRIVDVFPAHQQQQIRMQLSTSLEGVLSQTLLRSTDGRSRVMALEIMLGIPAIRNLIREGKTHQMETIIQGGGALGMQTLDQSLKNLLTAGKVTFEEAIAKAKNPRDLAQMVGRKI